MAPHPKNIDAKKKVDWSCKNCTKNAKKATRAKGHLNYANDDFCRECREHKCDVHLCAFTDLERKLNAWNDQGGQSRAWGADGANDKKANNKVNNKKSIANQKVSELQTQNQELEKKLKEATGAGTDADGK